MPLPGLPLARLARTNECSLRYRGSVARDDGTDRLLVVLNFGDEPQAVSLPEAVGSTDLRTGSPLRKRYAETDPDAADDPDGDSYLLVDDVVICRSA